MRRFKRRWIVSEAQKNQPFDFACVDLRQTELRFVQVLLHAATSEQCSVASVGPLVIRANQSRDMPGRLGSKQRAAVTADIVQAADAAVIIANDDNRIRIDLDREKVTRLWYLA